MEKITVETPEVRSDKRKPREKKKKKRKNEIKGERKERKRKKKKEKRKRKKKKERGKRKRNQKTKLGYKHGKPSVPKSAVFAESTIARFYTAKPPLAASSSFNRSSPRWVGTI